jgi:hypothetical protein
MAVAGTTAAQHALMIVRRRASAVFLAHGLGAETTIHTLATNVLCILLCAEISGLSDLFQVVVSCTAHLLAFVLATAVLLHMHGAGERTRLKIQVPSAFRSICSGGVKMVDTEAGGGAGTGGDESVTEEAGEGGRPRWFCVCPVRMGTSHPPMYTTMLAGTARGVAFLLCFLPWVWVMIHYVMGVRSKNRPDVTITMLPPLLLLLNAVKLAWIPGIAWARSTRNTRRVYFTETLFDLSITFSILFCAMVDLVVPAATLVHATSDGDNA